MIVQYDAFAQDHSRVSKLTYFQRLPVILFFVTFNDTETAVLILGLL